MGCTQRHRENNRAGAAAFEAAKEADRQNGIIQRGITAGHGGIVPL